MEVQFLNPGERKAPLASMEDLSMLGTPLATPMATPLTTPCPSPRTRKRWSHLSHRSSLGTILDNEEEKLVSSQEEEERFVFEEEQETLKHEKDHVSPESVDGKEHQLLLLPDCSWIMPQVTSLPKPRMLPPEPPARSKSTALTSSSPPPRSKSTAFSSSSPSPPTRSKSTAFSSSSSSPPTRSKSAAFSSSSSSPPTRSTTISPFPSSLSPLSLQGRTNVLTPSVPNTSTPLLTNTMSEPSDRYICSKRGPSNGGHSQDCKAPHNGSKSPYCPVKSNINGGKSPYNPVKVNHNGGKSPYCSVNNSSNGNKSVYCPVKSNCNGGLELEQPMFLTPRRNYRKSSGRKVLPNGQDLFSYQKLEMAEPPKDRWNLIYVALVLHGVGTLMPWNMFITAKTVRDYFVDYKLGTEYTRVQTSFSPFFIQYVALATQIPNFVFNWINVFFHIGGNMTTRMVWSLLAEILVLIVTIVLAMVDTTHWPEIFFYLTIASVIFLNVANGVYQNTIYGLAARLPFKYTGAVVLGSNLSGTIIAVINILSVWLSPNPRTAAIYYFITALFILLACFDSYFALPLNRFYRYHEHQHQKALLDSRKAVIYALPYMAIFKQCLPQLVNIFLTFTITLTIFPANHSEIDRVYSSFFIPKEFFVPVTCFLTFNVSAVLGNILPSLFLWPSPRWLIVPVLLRLVFIPFFLLCNFQPTGVERLWPVFFHWDVVYWVGAMLFGLTGGYVSSLALMYCPRTVAPEYAPTAGMMGAAAIVTGVLCGIGLSCLLPVIVSEPALDFGELPEFWPPYDPSR